MQNEKENVDVETTGAETITEVTGENKQNQEVLAVLGKFKDVDALAKAYGSLQAEFTRRSQRLKELEREVENFRSQSANNADSGVEKLRKKAEQKREEGKEFAKFLSELETGGENRLLEGVDGDFVKPMTQEERTRADGDENDGNESEMKTATEKEVFVGQNAGSHKCKNGDLSAETARDLERGATVGVGRESAVAEDSERLYERVSRDENVRLKIIGEYLSSLGKVNAPLMRGGASTLVSPPLKAKSIDEAGGMALRFFKKN